MKNFGIEVGQVCHHKDEDRLDDPNLVRETGDETGGEAPNDADDSASNRHHNEGRKTRQDLRVGDPRSAHFAVRLEHVVQHLRQK